MIASTQNLKNEKNKFSQPLAVTRRIASMSKSFTEMAIVKLRNESKRNLLREMQQPWRFGSLNDQYK
jgi:hypothetical protein